MKKFCFLLLVLIVPLCLFGCSKSNLELAKANMSEITTIFFLGQDDGDRVSISVGTRENPYVRDGVHQPVCEFSLISLSAGEGVVNMRQDALIRVNGKESAITLELVGKSYLCDLEYCLSEDDEVELCYNNKTIKLEKQNFNIDSDRAVQIGVSQLEEEFEGYKNRIGVYCECYLKVLGEVGSEFDELFWCFTLLGSDSKTYNVVINADNGSIISEK